MNLRYTFVLKKLLNCNEFPINYILFYRQYEKIFIKWFIKKGKNLRMKINIKLNKILQIDTHINNNYATLISYQFKNQF